MVTKGGYLKGSRLYKTSKTIKRGVTELYSYIYTKRIYILIYLYTKRTNIPIYLSIIIGRSYVTDLVLLVLRLLREDI